jgi:hypothetical protein
MVHSVLTVSFRESQAKAKYNKIRVYFIIDAKKIVPITARYELGSVTADLLVESCPVGLVRFIANNNVRGVDANLFQNIGLYRH